MRAAIFRNAVLTARYVSSRPTIHRNALHIVSGSHKQAPSPSSSTLALIATTPLATELIAHYFANQLHPGDCYLLHGDVGAGKSYFSRAFIRASLKDESAAVPSPTFLLQNIYEINQSTPLIYHYDLYRLTRPQELDRLELATELPRIVSLIEWPDRLPSNIIPDKNIAMYLSIVCDEEKIKIAGAYHPLKPEEEIDDDYDDIGNIGWRKIIIEPQGDHWIDRVDELKEHIAHRGSDLGLLLL